MSIQLTLWRLSSDAFERAAATGILGPEHVAESEDIGKGWDILQRILANGAAGDSPLAALSISGGTVLANEAMDYGGTRILSPAEVAQISADLNSLPDSAIAERWHRLDFTGAYSAEGSRPATPVEVYQRRFASLRTFYAEATENGDGMAIWLE